jgi:hypothetical protein
MRGKLQIPSTVEGISHYIRKGGNKRQQHEKVLSQYQPSGSRATGRPKQRWKDQDNLDQNEQALMDLKLNCASR